MAKKPVKTFHPLAMAKSIEAQNEVVGLFIAKVNSLVLLAPRLDLESLQAGIAKLGPEVEAVRAILYPEE